MAVAATVAAGAVAVLPATGAYADGPPSAGPYPKDYDYSGEPPMRCLDTDGGLLYEGFGWTLEPLVRGPAFAPVVLFLDNFDADGTEHTPVLPLDFTITGYPLQWSYPDGSGGGSIEHAYGRPVGFGPAATDTAPRVRCLVSMIGHYIFGDYRITPALRAILGLPAETVGRTVHFNNEVNVEFTVPRYLFPLTATVHQPALPVPDADSYPRAGLPRVTCTDGGNVRYRGAAYTLGPLVRGYRWAPMAFWLDGDRIVTPQWFSTAVTGRWRTVSGSPARSGTLEATNSARPRAYGSQPADATGGVACRWGGSHRTVTTVSPALAAQLDLPASVVGRQVELSGDYTTTAYTPRWLFPPA